MKNHYGSVARSSALQAMILILVSSCASVPSQIWMEQLGTALEEEARAAVPDESGGTYLVGRTWGSLGGPSSGGEDAWLARYDSSGAQLWIHQLGTNAEDSALAGAPDGAGGVYVAGRTVGSLGGPHAGGYDAWLARFDGAGNQLWIRQLGTSDWDQVFGAASDGSGGVYITGQTSGSLGGPNAGGEDAWLARYDSTGNQLWIRQFGTSGHDPARPAVPDGAGGVYLSGYTYGSLGGPNAGGSDAWMAHYDNAGDQLWVRQLGTSTHDYSNGAAPDGGGGLYVVGGTRSNLGGTYAGGDDAWLARYDGIGNQLWVRQLGTSANDAALAAASDGSGGLYVGGWTTGSLTGPNAGSLDGWIAAYSNSGVQLWGHQFGTHAEDTVWAVGPDGSRGVYLGGNTSGDLGAPIAGSKDAWLARFSGD